MSTGLLFVTAQDADFKQINRLMLHLRNWEYGQAGSWDGFRLVTTKNAYDIGKPDESRGSISVTAPPVDPDLFNGWQGGNLGDIEGFILDLAKPRNSTENQGFNSSMYILLDDKGLQDRTCILGERRFDDEAEEETNEFNKVRLPWDEASAMFGNLDIGNMDFEDYCDDSCGRDENGWYVYGKMGPDISEENARKRDEEIERLGREGMA
ncbi:hypothetical protein LTR85_005593 [Meristemomyces frigidus]|nr:hypothetical protein LTR85_005593 [Meristemomyces frigidus]